MSMLIPAIVDLYFEEEFAKFGLTYKRPRKRDTFSRRSSSASLTPSFHGLLYTDAAYLLESSCNGM